ncbi:Protein of unknown function [Gryllus bimaculatus]|nr:Protein of unknown function [Gryllus bimaculatus]
MQCLTAEWEVFSGCCRAGPIGLRPVVMARALILASVLLTLFAVAVADYNVGVGIADVTGPPTEITFVSVTFVQLKKALNENFGNALHRNCFPIMPVLSKRGIKETRDKGTRWTGQNEPRGQT